jgi:hypothetical protein
MAVPAGAGPLMGVPCVGQVNDGTRNKASLLGEPLSRSPCQRQGSRIMLRDYSR